MATAPPISAEDFAAPRETLAHAARRYIVTPAVIALILLGLFLYIQAQDLDSIELRVIESDNLIQRGIEHVGLTAASTAGVIALAVPTGILLTRPGARRLTPVVLAAANIGQATPSIGILVLFAIVWTIGFGPAVVALITYSFLPILRNTMVGLEGVDRSIIEAGRGMGMSKTKALFTIELPLAVPVILAGIRTALVINVGTAALAWATNAGGLGDVIQIGIATQRDPILITGAVLTAALALTIDWMGGVAEHALRPEGL